LPKPGTEDKSFAENMAESIRKGMQTVGVNPNMRGNPTGGMDGFDLSTISKDIATSFTSVSGGSETTTQRKQSSESSAAEKEMEALTKKYHTDWAERKKVLIDGMAIEDRKFSKVQAAMKVDEAAIKIKEEYETKQKELQKKIADGITWETTQKTQQVEAAKKQATDEQNEAKLRLIGIQQGSEAEQTARKDLTNTITAKNKFDPNINDGGTSYRDGEREYAERAAAEGNRRNLAKLNADFDKALGIKSPAGTATDASTEGKTSTPRLPAMDLNAINLPGFGPGIKAKAANVTAPKPESQPAADSKTPPTASSPKPAGTPSKESTLNDVVNSLESLNMQMGRLIAQQEDLGNRQVRATKNAGSSNLFKA
jgi:hypothetical protein